MSFDEVPLAKEKTKVWEFSLYFYNELTVHYIYFDYQRIKN